MLRCIYSFKLLSRLTSGLYNNAEMRTHTGFPDPLFSRSIVKPRIVRYIRCAPYSVSATSDAWKKRGNERRNVICSQQQSFRASNVFFCLGYITRPYLRVECFAEITCQNAYFLPASKFLFAVGRKNVSMWQDVSLRNCAYYSLSYTCIFVFLI